MSTKNVQYDLKRFKIGPTKVTMTD